MPSRIPVRSRMRGGPCKRTGSIMYGNEYYSNFGAPVPRTSCPTAPAARVEWPPPVLVIGQLIFTALLYVLGAGLINAVIAALVLIIGDMLAVNCRVSALRAFALRLLGATAVA
ncbi:hypothetical protein BCF44_13610 [Kutzneria buriramensis]|uniref:Uncharacterized protein n=1 Tax=Kutzneria buriramensis TaxID=1045776 RepID=A0A3E0G7D9_9PSEU|nr:hypothetical protein BCF44_13610 [Kutzneria buriramensis]